MKRSAYIDLIGKRFGKLVVVEKLLSNAHGQTRWRCLCDCGSYSKPLGQALRNGRIKSCGCAGRKNKGGISQHGISRTREYKSWSSMIWRCASTSGRNWNRYGSRGIDVCDDWKNSFEQFLSDMGNRPIGKTLDRINNDLGYSSKNCRWATLKEQSRNRRNTLKFSIFGITASLPDWVDMVELDYWYVKQRIKRGTDPIIALGLEDLHIAWG